MNNIVCMKWGDKFGPEYVNRLHSMVKNNITLTFRFICFTDNPEGINSDIETFLFPKGEIKGKNKHCWRKLTIFTNPLEDITGTILFLDLDVVIVDNIDCFFEPKEEFIIIKEWMPSHGLGNSSVYRFQAGGHSDVLEYYLENTEDVIKNYRHEQDYLTCFMKKQNNLAFWDPSWCVSFKHNCIPPFPFNLWKEPIIPENAKIAIFHGQPSPREAIAGRVEGVNRFARIFRPAKWVKKYWES